MRTGIVIQARTSSTRLPGKVLKELPLGSGVSVLEHVLRRAKRSRKSDVVIVATTTGKEDDPIVRIARREGVPVFRGSRDDVLSRYYWAARENCLELVVRVTSDCPCIDPRIIDSVIDRHLRDGRDYTYNRGFPHGLELEAVSLPALETAFRCARKDCEREHVTVYMQESHPERFRIGVLDAQGPLRRPEIRITLDTEEDYALLCALFDLLPARCRNFGARDIVALFDRHPWLFAMNAGVYQKKAIHTAAQEFKEARAFLKLYGFPRAARFLRRCR